MSLRVSIIFLILGSSSIGAAQIQNSVWYFGDGAGLRFSDGPPLVLYDNALAVGKAMGSYCDQNGDVVLYTEGVSIYNGQHQLVPNGTGFTFTLSTPNSFVLPISDNADRSFVFNWIAPNGSSIHRMEFHEVDMARNSGAGEVIVRDSLFRDSVVSAIVAVPHCSGSGDWLVLHEQLGNRFLSVFVDSTGISNSTVSSSIGPTLDLYTGSVDFLQVSPQLNRLVFAYRNSIGRHLDLFDFDPCTGVVSNPLPIGTGEYFTGPQFSPNGNVLYGAEASILCDTTGTRLWQYDLSSGDSTVIRNTRTLVHAQPFGACKGGMFGSALAPNGKVYVSHWDTTCIGVIDQPDVVGLGCGFSYCGQDLGGRKCYFGLPHLAKYAIGPNGLDATEREQQAMQVYPVPAQDGFWVEHAPEGYMTLSDMQGRVVYARFDAPYGQRVWIPRGGLPGGCYLLRVLGTTGTAPEHHMVVFR